MQTVLGNTIYGAATPCNTHITHFPPQKSSVDTNANVRRVLNDLIKSVLRVSSRNNEIERRCTIEYRSQSTVMKVVWHRMCGFEVFCFFINISHLSVCGDSHGTIQHAKDSVARYPAGSI